METGSGTNLLVNHTSSKDHQSNHQRNRQRIIKNASICRQRGRLGRLGGGFWCQSAHVLWLTLSHKQSDRHSPLGGAMNGMHYPVNTYQNAIYFLLFLIFLLFLFFVIFLIFFCYLLFVWLFGDPSFFLSAFLAKDFFKARLLGEKDGKERERKLVLGVCFGSLL